MTLRTLRLAFDLEFEGTMTTETEGTIAALPIELLTAIFRIHVASQRYSRYPYKWISITHVCRFWREIALHQVPDLWTRIVVLRPECVLAMLERSKNGLLSVEVGSIYWTPAVRHLVPHISRIRSLELKGPFVRYDEFAYKSTTPVLEELCLIGYRYAFTDVIFCQTLRHLEIRGTSDFASLQDSGQKMLAAFAKMVMLETVILESTTFLLPFTNQQTPTDSVTYLAHLKSLHLIEPANSCTFLLSHLRFPSSTRIRLECLGDSYGVEVHSLLDIIRGRANDSHDDDSDPFHSFLADIQEDTWSFYSWTAKIDPKALDLPDAKFSLQISTQRAYIHDLAEVCRSLPLDDVNTLTIRSCGISDALALLGSDPMLVERGLKAPLFPQLETLILDHINFHEGWWGPDWFEAFGQFLMARQKRQDQIPSLALRRCQGITQDVIRLFTSAVQLVWWDAEMVSN